MVAIVFQDAGLFPSSIEDVIWARYLRPLKLADLGRFSGHRYTAAGKIAAFPIAVVAKVDSRLFSLEIKRVIRKFILEHRTQLTQSRVGSNPPGGEVSFSI